MIRSKDIREWLSTCTSSSTTVSALPGEINDVILCFLVHKYLMHNINVTLLNQSYTKLYSVSCSNNNDQATRYYF